MWEYQTTLSASWEIYMWVKKEQLGPYKEQLTGWKLAKVYDKGYILWLCLFNYCAENILQNAGLDESQAGIKISRRNINNLRYADDTTLMAES